MKLPFKKGKEVVFQKVKSQKGFTLENQDGKLTDFGDVDIEDVSYTGPVCDSDGAQTPE